MNLDRVLESPSTQFWMGTDSLGRALAPRVIEGLLTTVAIAGAATGLAVLVGVVIGYSAAEARPRTEMAVLRGVDLLDALPDFLWAALICLGLQTANVSPFVSLVLAMGLTHWLDIARLTRVLVHRENREPYLDAARALGGGRWWILRTHLWPELRRGTLTLALTQFPQIVLFESTLSFFGLGLTPPTVTLGQLFQEGWRAMPVAGHLILFPSLALVLLMLSVRVLTSGRK